MSLALCADMGGTNWKLAVMEKGTPLAFMQTPNNHSYHDLVQLPSHFASLLEQIGASMSDCIGLGLSIPEIVDVNQKTCPSPSPKHPYFEKKNIEEVVHAHLNLPIEVDNDARAALFGEEEYGVLKGRNLTSANHVMITLGTGIGVGIRVNGTILRGLNGAGATLGGHMTIDQNGPQCICCLLYTSPSPRDRQKSRMPSSA